MCVCMSESECPMCRCLPRLEEGIWSRAPGASQGWEVPDVGAGKWTEICQQSKEIGNEEKNLGAGEIFRGLVHLLCQHEDLSLNSKHPLTRWAWLCEPSTGAVRCILELVEWWSFSSGVVVLWAILTEKTLDPSSGLMLVPLHMHLHPRQHGMHTGEKILLFVVIKDG